MATVQELAKQARDCFIFTGENHPSLRDNIWITRDENRPDWLQEMIRDAGHHDADILPDDWCYEMVVNALDTIIETPDGDDIGDWMCQQSFEYVSIYNHELLKWVSSHASRLDLANEAMADLEQPDTITEPIAHGQHTEIDSIFQSVYQFLASLAEETEDD